MHLLFLLIQLVFLGLFFVLNQGLIILILLGVCVCFVFFYFLIQILPKFSKKSPALDVWEKDNVAIVDQIRFFLVRHQERLFFYGATLSFYFGVVVISYGLSLIYKIPIELFVNVATCIATLALCALFFWARTGMLKKYIRFLYRAHTMFSLALYLFLGGWLYFAGKIWLSFLFIFNPAILMLSVLVIHIFDESAPRSYRWYNYILFFLSCLGGVYMVSKIYFWVYPKFFMVLLLSLVGLFYGFVLPFLVGLSVQDVDRKAFVAQSKNIAFVCEIIVAVAGMYFLYTMTRLSPELALIPLFCSLVYCFWVFMVKDQIFPISASLVIVLAVYSYFVMQADVLSFLLFLLVTIFPAVVFLSSALFLRDKMSLKGAVVMGCAGIIYMVVSGFVVVFRIIPMLGDFRPQILHVGALLVVQSFVWYFAWACATIIKRRRRAAWL